MPEEKKESNEKDVMKDILLKYRQKLDSQLNMQKEAEPKVVFSREYNQFKKEYMPNHLTYYERLCNFSEKIFKISPDKKKEPLIQASINICHLNASPTGVMSFSFLFPLFVMFFGSIVSYLIFESFFFVFVFIIMGAVLITPLQRLPDFLANSWRLKASNQMVLCVFYVVTYMRHTSNLENAIDFASEHLSPPLSLDLKKVLWDVETEKFESVKESLDSYLETWRKWNSEFIESIHLIESSLYESSNERRLTLLDKSLDVILEETYEKMLHYAQNLKSPITMLHMMGIILPILGLVILPLIVSFMETVKWYHIATLYNFILPISIYYMGKNILSKRPTGYGDTDISEDNPDFKKYRNIIFNIAGIEIKIPPIWVASIVFIVLFLIGISPLLLGQSYDFNIGENFKFLDYRESKTEEGTLIGPYGLGASILSIFVTLSIGLCIGIYFKLKSKNVIGIRENTKKLEQEFASALFQLGNRLGDGIPAEIAFEKVSSSMRDTISGRFFSVVSTNIRKLGMGVKEAIFNEKTGALVYFPSKIIESSMKVLIESVKKGPKIAARALVSISRYVKEIHRVNERLKDLMADIISSMKSQIAFLTPAISGIVVGITSMITAIIGKLSIMLPEVSGAAGDAGAGNLISLFGDSIPTYHFQIIVGIYVIQIIYILTILSNGIENGSDKLAERYNLGNNLIRSTVLYAAISLMVILIFNFVAGMVMARSVG